MHWLTGYVATVPLLPEWPRLFGRMTRAHTDVAVFPHVRHLVHTNTPPRCSAIGPVYVMAPIQPHSPAPVGTHKLSAADQRRHGSSVSTLSNKQVLSMQYWWVLSFFSLWSTQPVSAASPISMAEVSYAHATMAAPRQVPAPSPMGPLSSRLWRPEKCEAEHHSHSSQSSSSQDCHALLLNKPWGSESHKCALTPLSL
jgi:hypothetical protein